MRDVRAFFKILPTVASVFSLVAVQACGFGNSSAPMSAQSSVSKEKIGLLFASHGDIDNPEKELENYIKVSFQKNVGIPLPLWSRKLVEEPAYRLSVNTVRSQYDKIGPTRYYENSLKQISVINEEFKTILPNAKAYVGFNFTYPYIEDTLEQMRKDGVTTIVVVNKGAQFSYASSGENMEDVLKYFKKHPEYDATALGVTWYANDNRFTDVMAKSLDADVREAFPGVARKDVCILLGSHGLPQWLIDTGDSAVAQMKRSVVEIRKKMPEYRIYHGFLNDDFFPGAKWVGPKASVLAPQLAKDGCKNVAMDGRLSFTTHHRATLFDLNVDVRNIFSAESQKMKLDNAGSQEIKSVLLRNFDENRDHARLIAEVVSDAVQNKGLLIPLKKKGQPAMDPESIGKPGMFLPGVTHMGEDPREWSASPK